MSIHHTPTSEPGFTPAIENGHRTAGVDPAVRRSPFLSKQSKDITLFEYKRWRDEGRLDLAPEWQRGHVWDDERASTFIESLVLQIPIPAVFLAKTETERYEVIDGAQRLTTVLRFLDDAFPLGGLSVRTDLNGTRFRDLPDGLRSQLEDAVVPAFVLSGATSRELFFLMFERFNTGVPASTASLDLSL